MGEVAKKQITELGCEKGVVSAGPHTEHHWRCS